MLPPQPHGDGPMPSLTKRGHLPRAEIDINATGEQILKQSQQQQSISHIQLSGTQGISFPKKEVKCELGECVCGQIHTTVHPVNGKNHPLPQQQCEHGD